MISELIRIGNACPSDRPAWVATPAKNMRCVHVDLDDSGAVYRMEERPHDGLVPWCSRSNGKGMPHVGFDNANSTFGVRLAERQPTASNDWASKLRDLLIAADSVPAKAFLAFIDAYAPEARTTGSITACGTTISLFAAVETSTASGKASQAKDQGATIFVTVHGVPVFDDPAVVSKIGAAFAATMKCEDSTELCRICGNPAVTVWPEGQTASAGGSRLSLFAVKKDSDAFNSAFGPSRERLAPYCPDCVNAATVGLRVLNDRSVAVGDVRICFAGTFAESEDPFAQLASKEAGGDAHLAAAQAGLRTGEQIRSTGHAEVVILAVRKGKKDRLRFLSWEHTDAPAVVDNIRSWVRNSDVSNLTIFGKQSRTPTPASMAKSLTHSSNDVSAGDSLAWASSVVHGTPLPDRFVSAAVSAFAKFRHTYPEGQTFPRSGKSLPLEMSKAFDRATSLLAIIAHATHNPGDPMTEPQKDALEALGRTWAVLAQIQNAAQRAGHSSEGARLAPRLGQLLEQPQSALTTAMTRATRAWIPRLNGLGNLLYERLIEAHAACGDVPSRLTAAQRAVVLHGFTAAETEDRRRRDDNTRSDPNNSNQKDPS